MGKMRILIELTGLRVGRWSVLDRAADGKNGQPRWNCICDCGKAKTVLGTHLRQGFSPASYSSKSKGSLSCGCRQKETARALAILNTTHGQSKTPRYHMYITAKRRARREGVPFSLLLANFPQIPEICPVLGMPLKAGIGKTVPASPSLDRIIPQLGYVEGNIQIISHRANTIKNDASASEVLAVATHMGQSDPVTNNEALWRTVQRVAGNGLCSGLIWL